MKKKLFRIIVFLMFFMTHPFNGVAGMTAYVGEVPPFTIVNEDGSITGASVDLVLEVMEMAGFPLDADDILHVNWPRAIYDVEHTPGTMIFGTARTPQREGKFKWVGPIAELKMGLIAQKDPRIEIHDSKELRDYEIGVVRNSAPMQILQSVHGVPDESITQLVDSSQLFRMLQAGRVDLITETDVSSSVWVKSLGMKQDDFEMVYVLKRLPLYVAFNRLTSDDTIKKIQMNLDAMMKPGPEGRSRYDDILERYMKDGPISMQKK